MKIGLVLEGGGMRGLYTVGVLDALMEQEIWVDEVVGVSAGACNGVSYVSRQLGRGVKVNLDYLGDKRYLSWSNFWHTRSLFGMDFIFQEIPDRLVPFDYCAFQKSPCDFWAGVTDVQTGDPVYFGKEDLVNNSQVLRASSAIPVFSPMVPYKGGLYLDGGTSAPIPIQKALADGCDRLLVVLTRERSYVKGPEKFRWIYRRVFRSYPAMVQVLDKRHEIYNATLEQLHVLEKEGRALVLAPKASLRLSRFEKDRNKLLQAHAQGHDQVLEQLERIRTFCQGV